MFWLLIALAVSSSQSQVIHDHFHLVKVEHIHAADGVTVIDQLIWYDRDEMHNCLRVQAWRLIRNCRDKSDPDHKRKWLALREAAGIATAGRYAWVESQYPGKYVVGPMHPKRNYRTGKWEVTYRDGTVLRVITADVFVQYASCTDSELEDKEKFPVEDRRDLTPISK